MSNSFNRPPPYFSVLCCLCLLSLSQMPRQYNRTRPNGWVVRSIRLTGLPGRTDWCTPKHTRTHTRSYIEILDCNVELAPIGGQLANVVWSPYLSAVLITTQLRHIQVCHLHPFLSVLYSLCMHICVWCSCSIVIERAQPSFRHSLDAAKTLESNILILHGALHWPRIIYRDACCLLPPSRIHWQISSVRTNM